jgi:hypothetical protein
MKRDRAGTPEQATKRPNLSRSCLNKRVEVDRFIEEL